MAGILAAGVLGALSLRTPIVIGGAGFVVLAVVMAVVMFEERFTPTSTQQQGSWAHMRATTMEGLRAARRPGVVRTFLVIGLLAGLTSEVFDRLWVDRIVNDIGLPSVGILEGAAVWFALIALVGTLIGLVVSVLANRLAPLTLNAEHPTRVMGLLVLIQVIGVAAFALAGALGVALAGRWTRDAVDDEPGRRRGSGGGRPRPRRIRWPRRCAAGAAGGGSDPGASCRVVCPPASAR